MCVRHPMPFAAQGKTLGLARAAITAWATAVIAIDILSFKWRSKMAFLKISRAFATFALLSILLTVITPSSARAETSALAKFKGEWVLQEANNIKLVTVSNVSGQGLKVNAQDKDAVVDEVNAR